MSWWIVAESLLVALKGPQARQARGPTRPGGPLRWLVVKRCRSLFPGRRRRRSCFPKGLVLKSFTVLQVRPIRTQPRNSQQRLLYLQKATEEMRLSEVKLRGETPPNPPFVAVFCCQTVWNFWIHLLIHSSGELMRCWEPSHFLNFIFSLSCRKSYNKKQQRDGIEKKRTDLVSNSLTLSVTGGMCHVTCVSDPRLIKTSSDVISSAATRCVRGRFALLTPATSPPRPRLPPPSLGARLLTVTVLQGRT